MGRTILYLASDLIWATKIKSTADELGVNARPARNADMLRARLGDSDVAALFLDLEAPEAAWSLLDALASEGAAERVRTIAWGPHVSTDLLAEAERRGAATMTRGAFHAKLPKLLVELSSGDDKV
ncbi:MAG: hypothetical protein CMJ31_03380 [Phycisphaerae bacterium]|nr:hypothetical protein [Phycisphaerae bacterium]|tara:strand:- start:30 stop:404 length:375 start_codon:yes stop_codon:yes gene_type:complete